MSASLDEATQVQLHADLQQRLASLQQEIALATQNAQTVTLDQTSVGRLSRLDAMQQQAMAQANLGRLQLQRRRTEAALQRLASGGYGICCDCAGMIDVQRLHGDPATPFCADCQQERESERRASSSD